ncbi:MAG: SapC family protein [Lysobacterales bacterium]
MTQHAILDNITHKDLKIVPGYRPGQGFEVSVARVFPLEFSQLQMEYPIVFTRNKETGHFEPIAILGLERDENLFLTDAGWGARYIPLTIQRQPFLIGFQESVEAGVPQRNPVVHIDLDHPKVSQTEGEPVFLSHGGESELLERMSSILMTIHQGADVNERFSKVLVGLDLIEPSTMEMVLDNGETLNLSGLHIINEDRLKALAGPALEALHQHGHLQDVFMMLASLPNFRRLIDRKNARLKAQGDLQS